MGTLFILIIAFIALCKQANDDLFKEPKPKKGTWTQLSFFDNPDHKKVTSRYRKLRKRFTKHS